MKNISRREAIKLGTAAAISCIGTSARAAKAKSKTKTEPTIGLSTLGFNSYTNKQLAEELQREGIKVIQLFLNQTDSRYWKYNGRSDLSTLSAKKCAEIADDYRSAGVDIHSIGVYTDLINPDAKEREANLKYFDGMMKVGDDMGVKIFITETGHHHPEKPEPGLAYHFREDVWNNMVETGKELAEMAEHHKAKVLYEPYYNGFLASAKRTKVFLEEIDSPRVRALLDPANILELNDLEEMFGQLNGRIDCLHAKDRKLHVAQGVPAGQGDLDYIKFVELAGKYCPEAPFILEYVGPKDYKQAIAILQKAIKQQGG